MEQEPEYEDWASARRRAASGCKAREHTEAPGHKGRLVGGTGCPQREVACPAVWVLAVPSLKLLPKRPKNSGVTVADVVEAVT
jgi:hypothetical protein